MDVYSRLLNTLFSDNNTSVVDVNTHNVCTCQQQPPPHSTVSFTLRAHESRCIDVPLTVHDALQGFIQ